MKIIARVLESTSYGYNMLTWQIFENNEKISLAREIGLIRFQEFEGQFFNPSYVINTDNLKFINEMYKIAKHIKSISNYKTTSNEIRNRLNFQEIRLINNDFHFVKDCGKNAYHTIDTYTNEVYSIIVAKDNKQAARICNNETYKKIVPKFLYKIDFD